MTWLRYVLHAEVQAYEAKGWKLRSNLGHHGIGIEREPKYFDIACRRIEAAYKQPDLFIEQPKPKAEQTSFNLEVPE